MVIRFIKKNFLPKKITRFWLVALLLNIAVWAFALQQSSIANLQIATFNNPAIDFLNLGIDEFKNTMSSLRPGETGRFNYDLNLDEARIFHTGSGTDHFATQVKIDKLDKKVLLIGLEIKGNIGIENLRDYLINKKTPFLKLVSKTEADNKILATPNLDSFTSAFIKEAGKLLGFTPDYVFRMVDYTDDNTQVKSLLSVRDDRYMFALLISSLSFFIYLWQSFRTNALATPKMNIRNRKRGASLVETTLLIALIISVAMLAVEGLGKKAACAIYTAAFEIQMAGNSGYGGGGVHPDSTSFCCNCPPTPPAFICAAISVGVPPMANCV